MSPSLPEPGVTPVTIARSPLGSEKPVLMAGRSSACRIVESSMLATPEAGLKAMPASVTSRAMAGAVARSTLRSSPPARAKVSSSALRETKLPSAGAKVSSLLAPEEA